MKSNIFWRRTLSLVLGEDGGLRFGGLARLAVGWFKGWPLSTELNSSVSPISFSSDRPRELDRMMPFSFRSYNLGRKAPKGEAGEVGVAAFGCAGAGGASFAFFGGKLDPLAEVALSFSLCVSSRSNIF